MIMPKYLNHNLSNTILILQCLNTEVFLKEDDGF